MNIETLNHIVFLLVLGIYLCVTASGLLGLLAYDFKQIRVYKKAQAHPNSRLLRARPLVSVVLHADSSQDYLESSLQSITQNAYRKYEIIIITEDARANIKQLIRSYAKLYPSKKITLVEKRNQSPQDLIGQKSKGKFTLQLTAGQMLEKHSLHNCAKYLALDPEAKALKLRQKTKVDYTIAGLLQQFEEALGDQWAKIKSQMGHEKSSGSGIICANQNLLPHYAHYFSAATIYNKPKNSILTPLKNSGINNLFRRLALAAVLVLVGYYVYVDLTYKYAALLAMAWAGLLFCLGFAVWCDEHLSTLKKLQLISMAPMVSVLIYLLSILKIFIKSNG